MVTQQNKTKINMGVKYGFNQIFIILVKMYYLEILYLKKEKKKELVLPRSKSSIS